MKAIKYRIKIITYKSGRVVYFAQKKKRLGWYYLDGKGGAVSYSLECGSRKDALDRIDKNYNGNANVESINFEYITKNI